MNFDYPGYALTFVQKEPCEDESPHLYTLVFKFYSPVTKHCYVLRADYHEVDVFAVKFYCKKDRHSEHKYSKIVNKGDVGNILITCLKVVPLLLDKFPTASFAFAGSRSIDFKSKKVESYTRTQRFRIYKYVVAQKIGSRTFAHYSFDKVSSYLLVNKKVGDIEKTKAMMVWMFADTYEDLHDV